MQPNTRSPVTMGAPIQAFTRISDEPIEIHNNIENPSVVVVLDETLLSFVPVTRGLTADGAVIVNTCSPPDQLRGSLRVEGGRVACIDASGIAMETLKRDMPNTPMIGALAKVTGLFTLDQVRDHVAKTFGKKFAQEVIDANLEAVTRAYEEVQIA